jgi:hypothetical protein
MCREHRCLCTGLASLSPDRAPDRRTSLKDRKDVRSCGICRESLEEVLP